MRDPALNKSFILGWFTSQVFLYIMANYATLRDGEVTEGSFMIHTQLAA